ncbi:MAG: hypothetical protein ACI8V5_004360, partial [Limisphaerales bacterium]
FHPVIACYQPFYVGTLGKTPRSIGRFAYGDEIRAPISKLGAKTAK